MTEVMMTWVPVLLLIAFWFVMMLWTKGSKTVVKQREWQTRSIQHMDRVEALLERIASRTETTR